jgi:hypothetical protein
LAPTVGPAVAAAGDFFRTGPYINSGERIASGLVLRFGSLHCINDNAACFANRPFPRAGSIIHFGEHRVYVAVISERYPGKVLSCSDPPLGVAYGCSSSADLCTHA